MNDMGPLIDLHKERDTALAARDTALAERDAANAALNAALNDLVAAQDRANAASDAFRNVAAAVKTKWGDRDGYADWHAEVAEDLDGDALADWNTHAGTTREVEVDLEYSVWMDGDIAIGDGYISVYQQLDSVTFSGVALTLPPGVDLDDIDSSDLDEYTDEYEGTYEVKEGDVLFTLGLESISESR